VPIKKMKYKPRAQVRLAHLLKRGRALLLKVVNLRDDDPFAAAKSVRLLRNYKADDWLTFRDELRLIWRPTLDIEELDQLQATEAKVAGLDPLTYRNEELYRAWDSVGGQPLEQWVAENWLHSERNSVRVSWGREKLLHPELSSVPAQLAWGVIHFAEKLAYCRNAACAHPFFIQTKADQRYCSVNCAARAERERKRRWWNENRGKNERGGH
jgi:hypothetical protein